MTADATKSDISAETFARLSRHLTHELNNPITAMLGYSDLLLNTPLSAEQRPLAGKIGQYVRRTRSLVASLISFARQTPAPKGPLDLNTLARTSVKLTQPQWETLAVEVRTHLDPAIPKVLGDSNQLLQVCLQLITNCLHLLSEGGGRATRLAVIGAAALQRAGKRDAAMALLAGDNVVLAAARRRLAAGASPSGGILDHNNELLEGRRTVAAKPRTGPARRLPRSRSRTTSCTLPTGTTRPSAATAP